MGKNIILKFIKDHKVSYLIGVIFMLLNSYVQTLFPKLLGQTIDIMKASGFSFYKVKLQIVYIMLVAILTFIFTYIWRNLIIGNARNLECHLRDQLYTHLQKLSPQFYNIRKTGDLIAYAINDISAVRMTFGPATAMSINGIVLCGISIYSMTQAINIKLTALALLPIPFIVFFMIKIGHLVQKRFKIVQECFASISDRVQENIYGIRVIKSYVQEESETDNFSKLNHNMMKSNLDMVKISSFLSPSIELCFCISFVMNLIIGGNMVLNNEISLGSFIAFNGYLTMIMKPVISIGRVITIFQRGVASLKRLNEIFDVSIDIQDGKELIDKPISGDIKFNNLTFHYPNTNKPALKNIDFNIASGQTIGILGATGSGKTTLVNLLLKLYNTEDNSIIIDGIDINKYSLNCLRDSIGYVPQDNFLFSSTIEENIRFFKDKYSLDDVYQATKLSCIYDNIIAFPKGFNSVLGERGVNLSGGQKQRISIARALIKNPPILILDDSLSAVDTVTESIILSNLKKSRKDKTTIIIAHRISAVKNADVILVIDEGRLCEIGCHDTLFDKKGVYYETYQEQFNKMEVQ